jgi:hypothetical protein
MPAQGKLEQNCLLLSATNVHQATSALGVNHPDITVHRKDVARSLARRSAAQPRSMA